MEKPILSCRCGGWIGRNYLWAFRATWPLCKIELFKDHLVFHYIFSKKIIPYKKITRIRKFHVYTVIEHVAGSSPEIGLVSWGKDMEKIRQILKTKTNK